MRIDAHAHVDPPRNAGGGDDPWASERRLLAAADALEIDYLCCSCLSASRPASPGDFVACNDHMADAIAQFPGRLLGYCYVNPGFLAEALREIERCVKELDFIGVKLYNEYLFDDPVVRPVIEKCIELDVPILHHAAHTWWPLPGQPFMSDAGNLGNVARAYPEAKIICGHLGGGGDWEWTVKALRDAPSLYVDTSGSVVDAKMIEMAASLLGPERLLFACDMTMCGGVAKLLAAEISEDDREMVFAGNMRRVLGGRV